MFGILKGCFRIVHESGGTLQYNPEKVCKITITALVLYNICRVYKLGLEEELFDENDDDNNSNNNNNNMTSAVGLY